MEDCDITKFTMACECAFFCLLISAWMGKLISASFKTTGLFWLSGTVQPAVPHKDT